MNRRLHILGIAWLGLLVLLLHFALSAAVFFCVGGVALIGLLALRRWRLPLWVYSVAAAVCLSSVSLFVYQNIFIYPTQTWAGKSVTIRGTVLDRVAFGNSTRLDLQINTVAAPEGLAGAKVRLTAPIGVDVAIGDVVKYTGKLTASPRDQARLYADGYRFFATAYTPLERLKFGEKPLWVEFARYREGIRKNLTLLLPRGEGTLLAAMLTGENGYIAPEIRRDYARTGVSHLLAVSGLHLAALSGMLEIALSALAISRRRRACLQVVVALLFMALTGFSPSVLRAGIMLLLSRLALLLGRDADTLNSLGAAVVLILLANPYGALDVGLQLSYLATMGIAAFTEPMTGVCTRLLLRRSLFEAHEVRPKTTALLSAMCVSPAASVLTTPILCWNFGQVSLIAIVVNFIIIPITAICIPAGMVCALLGFFPQMALFERLMGLVAGVSVSLINRIVQWFAGWKYAAVSVKEDYLVVWLSAVLLLFLFLWMRRAGWRTMVWTAQLSICSLLIAALSYGVFWKDTVHLVAVRYGNAVAIAYQGQAAVIGMPSNSYELQNLECFLKDNKTTSICLFLLQSEQERNHPVFEQLALTFSIEQTIAVDQMNGFDANLFGGQTKIWAEARRSDIIWIETGGTLIAKSSSMKPQIADILINRRNEMIVSPKMKQTTNERYYSGAVVALAANVGKYETREED